MRAALDSIAAVRAFLETGGDVLLLILATTLFMWTLILERFWYFRRVHPKVAREVIETWQARSDQTSWYALQIRDYLIAGLRRRLRHSLGLIGTLIALCPLLGLLGTVTGMIEVFEVMAISGSGNARAMASGVSKATIPTMAGMVAAISGLYFSTSLERSARLETERVESLLARA